MWNSSQAVPSRCGSHPAVWENGDKTTLTYTDGANSVKVSDVVTDKITLKFGVDGFDQSATLSSMGAFFDATTERIF